MVVDDEAVRFTLAAPNGQPVSPHLVLTSLLPPEAAARAREIPMQKTGFFASDLAVRQGP
jgi:hypothetical protein